VCLALSRTLVLATVAADIFVGYTTLLQLVGVLLGEEQVSNADVVDVGVRLSRSLGNIPVDLLLVGRALGLLDGITKQLDPNLDTMEIIARYVER